MAVQLASMSASQLNDLKLQMANLEALRKQHLSSFLDKIGEAALGVLIQAPKVEACSLGLDDMGKYHDHKDRPTATKMQAPVVRGIDGANRPFIAMKVDLSNGDERVTQIVEVVFLRYSLSSRQNHYVSMLYCMGSNGMRYESGLYSSGGMSEDQMERVGQLLTGEKIEHLCDSRYQLQLATE